MLQSPCISNKAKKDYRSKRKHKAETASKVWKIAAKLEQRFAEAIATGQSEELTTHALHFQNEDEDLLVLLQMYKDSDSLGKLEFCCPS